MKQIIKVVFIILNIAMVSPGLAAPEQQLIEEKLLPIFEDLCLNGGLTQHLSTLARGKDISLNVLFENEPQVVHVSATWEGRFWGWSSTLAKKEGSLPVFDWEKGTLHMPLVYTNQLWQSVPLTLVFSGPIFKQRSPQKKPEESQTPPVVKAVLLEASSTYRGELSARSPMVEAFLGNIQHIQQLTHTLTLAASEADHIYTAVVTGCDGAGNLCTGLGEWSPWKVLQGAAQLCVAGMSANRTMKAFSSPCSDSAATLLNQIESSGAQIHNFSLEINLLLDTLTHSLSGATNQLERLQALENDMVSASKEAQALSHTDYRDVLVLLGKAKAEGEAGQRHYARFESSVKEVYAVWREVFSAFSDLKASLDKQLSSAEEFSQALNDVRGKVHEMQLGFEKLSQPMEDQDISARMAATHKKEQDALQALAFEKILNMQKRSDVLLHELSAREQDVQQILAKARGQLSDLSSNAQGIRRNNDSILVEAKQIEHDIRLAKAEVKRLYHLSDILVGAAVAYTIPLGGPLAIGAGLLCVEATKRARNFGWVTK